MILLSNTAVAGKWWAEWNWNAYTQQTIGNKQRQLNDVILRTAQSPFSNGLLGESKADKKTRQHWNENHLCLTFYSLFSVFEHVFYTYFRFASISVPFCASVCVCAANGCVRAAVAAVFAIAFCLCFMIMIVIIGMQTATASTMWQYWASGSPNNHLLCTCVCACASVCVELWGHVLKLHTVSIVCAENRQFGFRIIKR